MKPTIRWILLLALSLPLLAACGQPEPPPHGAFDVLARRVPAKEEQAFFLDFKPAGQSGRHWQRIRDRIEANLVGQQALATILVEFRIEEYGLQDAIDGPAVSVYSDGTYHTIAQVSDDAAVREALSDRDGCPRQYGIPDRHRSGLGDHPSLSGHRPGPPGLAWGGGGVSVGLDTLDRVQPGGLGPVAAVGPARWPGTGSEYHSPPNAARLTPPE